MIIHLLTYILAFLLIEFTDYLINGRSVRPSIRPSISQSIKQSMNNLIKINK